MTVHMVVTCDMPMEGGTCGRQIADATSDIDHALRAATRHGWQVTLGGGARCPADHVQPMRR